MLHGYFDLPTFTFFDEKNIWTGSMFKYFNYRIIPIKKKADEDGESELHVLVWYGTQCFTKVTDFVAEYHEEFSAQGLEKAISDLTDEIEKFKKVRKTLF